MFVHEMKKKMADSRFTLSNQNIVENRRNLKKMRKNKNTLKTTQTWLNVWKTWATERKKLKNTSMHEQLAIEDVHD